MSLASHSASLHRILFGDVPPIRTIGFVTAPPRPDDDIESTRENRAGRMTLEEYLRCSNLGPVLVKGKLLEDAYLVPNIHREELVNIGRHFEQQAVIWGEKELDDFRFECIEAGQTQSTRSIGELAAATRRIPFFDDPSAELVLDGKVNELAYYSDRLPDNSLVRQLVQDIQKHTEAVFAGEYAACRGKYYWHHRGIVRESLWKLNRLWLCSIPCR